MIRIAITSDAFERIAATLPLGSVGFERELDAKGERMIWVASAVVDRGPCVGQARATAMSS